MASIQLINIVEFMMFMPLGPDIAKTLNIPLSDLGYLSGVYTVMEAISALFIAFFFNRFKQRTILVTLLIGSIIGMIGSALATNFTSLLIGRAMTGLFSGPLASLAMAIVIDSVSVKHRGYAIGYMSSAFSLASVIGVPACLELAHYGGWQFPLFILAIISLFTVLVVFRTHFTRDEDSQTHAPLTLSSLFNSWTRPEALVIQIVSVIGLASAFVLIPNISTYIQHNLHYSREDLTWFYLAGGATSFLTNQLAGYLVDHWSIFRITLIGVILSLFSIYSGFVLYPIYLPFVLIFMLYTAGNSMSAVARTTCVSHIPSADERMGFLLLHDTMCCLGISLGSSFSSLVLSVESTGKLVGMQQLGTIAMLLTLIFPIAIWWLERRLFRENLLINRLQCE